jgi:hypothetical protein
MMGRMRERPPVHQEDRVPAPGPVPAPLLRDAYFAWLRWLTFGLIHGRHWAVCLGPLTLLSFAPPVATADGWAWPITGGLLARAPGGCLTIAWREGALIATVDGYHPRLPRPLYEAFQERVHHAVMSRFLRRLRDTPPPANP